MYEKSVVIFFWNGYSEPSPILEEAVCILQGTNTLRESTNPTILLQQWVNCRADWVLKPEKENWIQTCLKIDLVSHPAQAEGLGKYLHKNSVCEKRR